LIANLDPLGLQQRAQPYVLNLEYFGLSDADLETEFFTNSRNAAISGRSKLKDILSTLKFIYCDTIGAEFAHVSDSEERIWLQDNFQSQRMQRRFTVDEKRNILWQLTAAEGLERYLHTKYVGQKRFSLEGGDSLIALLDDLVQYGGNAGVEETIIGMAHRGRLNVLVNLLGKSPKDLFQEFEGHYDLAKLRGSGDVKYHKGFSSDLKTTSGNVHVALAFNPSHLEIVNAVVEGSARARQERRSDAKGVRRECGHDARFESPQDGRSARRRRFGDAVRPFVQYQRTDDNGRGESGRFHSWSSTAAGGDILRAGGRRRIVDKEQEWMK